MSSTSEQLAAIADDLEDVDWSEARGITSVEASAFAGKLRRAAERTPGDKGTDESPQEAWERHNEPFEYEPPEGPAESWSSEDYTELHDRLIGRRTEWFCQHCSGAPFSSLEKARRHVGQQHGDHLYEKYGGSDE